MFLLSAWFFNFEPKFGLTYEEYSTYCRYFTFIKIGFHVNFEKRVTTSTQIIDFFWGLINDSKKFKVFSPRNKIDKIKNAAKSVL